MLLALDIGNSRIKGGWFEGPGLVRTFSIPSEPGALVGEALSEQIGSEAVERVGVASVVPSLTPVAVAAIRQQTGVEPVVIHSGMPLPFQLRYETPHTLGADRLAAASGAWALYGELNGPVRPVVAVDIGTAVTYEVIDRKRNYLGGAIGPGPLLVQWALHAGTAQLPEVMLEIPEEVIGRSTQEALQSGIMYGLLDAVDGMLRRIEERLGERPFVVATGGWSALLHEQSSRVDAVAPDLVLHGVRILMEQSVAVARQGRYDRGEN